MIAKNNRPSFYDSYITIESVIIGLVLQYLAGAVLDMKISYVIPCYNSGDNLAIVLSEISALMQEHRESEYEVILVNDCSSDCTWENIKQFAKADSHIIGFDLSRNFGQAGALMAGFSKATGTHIVTLEDDGQSGVEYVWPLIELLDENHDIACTRNVVLPNRGLVRTLGRKVNQFALDYFLEKPRDISPAIFFAAKRNVIDEMLKYDGPYPYIGGLILRVTSKIAQLDIVRKDRLSGTSGYSFKALVRLLANGVTSFSRKPFEIVNFTCFVGFVLIAVFAVLQILTGIGIVPHETSVSFGLFAQLLLGMMILLALALIGEYLGRSYMRLGNAPQFIIRNSTSHDSFNE